MKKASVRVGAAALAASVVLLTAACSSDETENEATEPAQEQEQEQQEDVAEGPTEVPDVTVLILETAQSNLAALGLEIEVVDADGAAVAAEDPTQYIVTDQDPAEGTVEAGDVVTLTVRER
ncbi:PASTA domain-containing protein [Actinotalea sp. BY-33]|uniref:PASTA domain-containing protein n=1 Tax=Actinotalea soli TaxID=2819234 RepID=A0A939LRY2_9CELL|nr:PASTA domain-containing protein [Actinotalea soli]MBO1750242.1 PASTA domain-containing protein [Actinotalea soli]